MSSQNIKVLPWGEEIYLEIPLAKKSLNKFYARHGKTAEGKEYLEFTKFGPKPNTEGETYKQKLRLYDAKQWVMVKRCMEDELTKSIGWDLTKAETELESKTQKETAAKTAA